MGAVTILYYLTKQYYWNNLHSGTTIRAVVLDSPFSNMQKLMYEVGSSKISLPDFVFTPVINSIMEKITMKLGFNLIKELDLIERVKQLKEKNIDSYRLIGKISALFITSLDDKLVNSSHVEALHQHYPFHPNDLHYFNGQHNENRSDNLKNRCAQFLCEIPEKK
jgi:hypothetical protein